VELSDEGAAFMAEGFQLLQGPSEAPMTAAQCKFADLDLIVSFWLVRPDCRQIHSWHAAWQPIAMTMGDGLHSIRVLCEQVPHAWEHIMADHQVVALQRHGFARLTCTFMMQGNRHVQQGLLAMGADVEGSPAHLHLRACIMACFRVRRWHTVKDHMVSHGMLPFRLPQCPHACSGHQGNGVSIERR